MTDPVQLCCKYAPIRTKPGNASVRYPRIRASAHCVRSKLASAPNQKLIADFTYFWTAEGWLYVAAVVDLFSRRVVGWAMKAEMTAQLVTDALLMAVWRRGKPDSLLHHSDQCSQYTSAIPAPDGRPRHHLLDEPVGQRLG